MSATSTAKPPSTEHLRKFLPEKSAEIKAINGYFYVYRYSGKKLANGHWGKASGKCIGKIVEGRGFIPNRFYLLEQKSRSSDAASQAPSPQEAYKPALEQIRVLEYGQYAMVYKIAGAVLKKLEQFFNADVASQIFSYAVILYVNGFVQMEQVNLHYQQSWLSLINKKLGFSMRRNALDTLLDNLARSSTGVLNCEQSMIDDCARSKGEIAIVGHAISSGPKDEDNDLAEGGYQHRDLKEDQVNLLMGYDAERGLPLFAKVFRGSATDKSTIKDLAERFEFKKVMFIVDRGFYSEDNLKLFSDNGCSFIIPLPANTNLFKSTMASVSYTDDFYYRSGEKHARIKYMQSDAGMNRKVIVFKDVEENERTRFNYQRSIDMGRDGYTSEGLEKNKDFFGVMVLLSNSKQSPDEIFSNYKKRWSIETFYQYLKNSADFNDLKIEDYYKEQGFAFIMLITGQINHYMDLAVKKLEDSTTSIYDALTMARIMKINLSKGIWRLCNTRAKDLLRMKKMGFEPDLALS
mgnify:CR=1 FL=1